MDDDWGKPYDSGNNILIFPCPTVCFSSSKTSGEYPVGAHLLARPLRKYRCFDAFEVLETCNNSRGWVDLKWGYTYPKMVGFYNRKSY